jgi:hypothetical protein
MTTDLRNPTLGTRLWNAGLGLMIAAAGAFFCWFLWKNHQIARLMDAWIETPCEILVSEIDDRALTQHGATKYTLTLLYRYEWNGDFYRSGRVRRHPIASTGREKVERWAERFPAGTRSTCRVNPRNPAESQLVPDSKAALYSIWFPGLFVVGGLGIAIGGLFRRIRVTSPR